LRTRTLSRGSTPTSSGARPSACSTTIAQPKIAPGVDAVTDGIRRTDTLVRALASSGVWLEREPIVVDARTIGALEAML
jgi:hypothetical protein